MDFPRQSTSRANGKILSNNEESTLIIDHEECNVSNATEPLISHGSNDKDNAKQKINSKYKMKISVKATSTRLVDRYCTFKSWAQGLIKTFGSPSLCLVGTIYAVQGFKSFSSLAIDYLLKDTFNLQPASSQVLRTTMAIPWGIKPVYGIISDSLPICGYRRRSYLFICAILAIFAFTVLSLESISSTVLAVTVCLFFSSLSTAVSDVVIDARVVEMSRLDPENGANDLQSLSWIMLSVGGVIGSLLAGPTLEYFGARVVFALSSIGPLIILILSIYIKEDRVHASNGKKSCMTSASSQFFVLIKSIRSPLIWKSALWIFLSSAISPGLHQISFYYVTDELHFTPEFLGTTRAVGYLFLMAGTVIYNTCFRTTRFRIILYYAQIGLSIVSFLDIILVTRLNLKFGIPDTMFFLGDEIVADVFYRLKSMPVFILCAKVCPPGIEGTLFALLMSISNLSHAISSYWGAILCYWIGIGKDRYENLWLAVLIRSVLKVVPIFFLFLIPDVCPQQEIDNQEFKQLKK